MAKIYNFPQGSERRKLIQKIQCDRNKYLSKNGWMKTSESKPSLNYFSAGWYYFRLSLASVLHIVSICGLAVLAAFSNAIFWIGGLICVVTWFTSNDHIWSAHNITILVVAGFLVLSLFAALLIDFINAKSAFGGVYIVESLVFPR